MTTLPWIGLPQLFERSVEKLASVRDYAYVVAESVGRLQHVRGEQHRVAPCGVLAHHLLQLESAVQAPTLAHLRAYWLRLRMSMPVAQAMTAAVHAATIACHGARASLVFGVVELAFGDVGFALVDAAGCG